MPGPTSSNDLLLEQLQELIRERSRDLNDGLSMRAIDRRIDQHAEYDRQEFRRLNELVIALATSVAEAKGHTEAMDTGRFNIPPTTINLEQPKKTKRPSIPPWLKVAAKPLSHWLGVVAIAVAVHLLARCGFPTPPPAPASTQIR